MGFAVELLMFVLPLVLGGYAIVHWWRARQNIVVGLGLGGGWWIPADIVSGFAICVLSIAGIFAVELALGVIAASWAPASPQALLDDLDQLVLAALLEEVLYRSLLLSGLAIVLRNKWMAILVSAVCFGVIHFGNEGATYVSAIGNTLGGVIYGVAFLGARSLWLALGLHIGWNFGQALFGFPISGFNLPGLFGLADLAPPIVTGGAYGPEAGLVGMAFRFVVLGLLWGYLHLRSRGRGNLLRLDYADGGSSAAGRFAG
jgi:membrane protease YdiL (CAAX protease family)